MAVKILFISLATNLDTLGELSGILGDGYEVTFIRGADRQKLEMALDGKTQYDIVHLMAHGCNDQLGTADGPIAEADIVSLLESQTALQFAVVAACDSYMIALGVHNALHIPVIGYNAPIDDHAAVLFSRAFYLALRRNSGKRAEDVEAAVRRAKEALAVYYPNEAAKARLINGVGLAPVVAIQLSRMDTQLTNIATVIVDSNAEVAANVKLTAAEVAAKLKQANLVGLRWQIIISVLLLLLIIVQIITPWLQLFLKVP